MTEELDRRDWMRLVAVLSVAAPAAAQSPAPPAQQGQRPNVPQRVSKENLHHALKLIGLEFTEEQEAMMLPGLNRALNGYEELRKIDVPLDTEPATRFYPTKPQVKAAKFTPTQERPKAFGSIEDLAFEPVTTLAALIKARKVSSTDLTKMYLERLKKYSPKLLCVITMTEELALQQAAKADDEIKHGRYRGPLHGIPWGAKDLYATKGIKTTWGAEPYQNQIFDYNATVVDRLEQQGAVLLAKLSMGALAQGGLWFAGMTKNPWNTERTSSGSSAGSASSTSAGLVGFSLGTETLGSIISPSTTCGVVGLRPTYGRVSRHGAMGLSWTMDKPGPICRTVEDCVLVLQAIHGTDGKDLAVVDAPLDWQPQLGLAGLRIGFLESDFARATGDSKAMYDQALADLRAAGAKLEPVKLPDFQAQPLRVILEAEAATAFDDLTRTGGVNQLRGQAANDWPNSFRTSRLIPAVEYIRAQRARTLLMQKMDKFMADWDVLVSPPFGGLLLVTNLTGHPQAVVPCGFINGLPQGLVFTGKLYEEGAPLRVAMTFEKATKWHTMHPKVEA
jgi:Asp-tRNA(Asn)/Glu-tRNA(Gln) amidotransferase A subunit family amidase/Asp-tRNA(Asn)/Glu-tRNA(Gln) amidotransferase C subunit